MRNVRVGTLSALSESLEAAHPGGSNLSPHQKTRYVPKMFEKHPALPVLRALFPGILASLVFLTSCSRSTSKGGNALDTLILGDPASESAHAYTSEHAEHIQGAMGETATRLLPLSPASHDGGSISFTMKVDPEKQNYVSARLWGSDKSAAKGHHLVLYADGKQVGYRRESDYDLLNRAETDPQSAGRFIYETRPLPLAMTKGRTEIPMKIVGLGSIYNYATVWDKYQSKLEEPTRGIYRIYTHTNPRIEPPVTEKQGTAPAVTESRSVAGPEVIEQSRKIVNERIAKALKSDPGTKWNDLGLLSDAYRVPWTPAYKNPAAVNLATKAADNLAAAFVFGGEMDNADKEVSKSWMGAFALGNAIAWMWPEIGENLDEPFPGKPDAGTRREVWTQALRRSIDYWRTHRRAFTNQAMLVDIGIYSCNRGLQKIAPDKALPEEQALRYVRESVGLESWMDSDVITETGDKPSNPYNGKYSVMTRKTLSRELGWVASYGETILTLMREIYDITGDEQIRQQLAKLQKSRLYFRYPVVGEDGKAGIKLSAEIDNRHSHFPQHGVAYSAPDSIKEHWGLEVAATIPEDPISLGVAQRFIADGYYFDHIASRLNDPQTQAMMHNIDDFEKIKALPKVEFKFPMEDGQPDFVFSDEENAVVALKHGNDRLFINLYFRAENAVNSVAKILEITPTITRIVTAKTNTTVIESGETYTRKDDIDWIRGDTSGRVPPGPKIHQAWAGEKLPISARPEGATAPKYGEFGPFVGRAAFYWLQYGDYLIGLNTTETNTYDLPVPAGQGTSTNLVTGQSVTPENGNVQVPPLSTVVLYLGK